MSPTDPMYARDEVHTLQVLRLSGEHLQVEVAGECTVQQLTRQVAEVWRLQPTTLRLLQDACMLAKGETVGNLTDTKITAISVQTSEYGLGAGDLCQTLHPVTVRGTEAFDSEEITQLPAGTVIQVVGVGEGRRLLVRGDGGQGWISYKTVRNIPLVARIAEESNLVDLEIGQQYEVRRSSQLLAESRPGSAALGKLAAGAQIVILEVLDAEEGDKAQGGVISQKLLHVQLPLVIRKHLRAKNCDEAGDGSLAAGGGWTGGRRAPSFVRVVVSSGAPHLGMDGWLSLEGIPRGKPLLQAVGGSMEEDVEEAEGDIWPLSALMNTVWRTFDP